MLFRARIKTRHNDISKIKRVLKIARKMGKNVYRCTYKNKICTIDINNKERYTFNFLPDGMSRRGVEITYSTTHAICINSLEPFISFKIIPSESPESWMVHVKFSAGNNDKKPLEFELF